MINGKALSLTALALVALALPATALALKLRADAHRLPARTPVSRPSGGVPEIGALYSSAGATQHGCTASVVHSRLGNTLITAAHCVSGSGAGMVFVPGQRGAQAPYGRWAVTAAHLEPKWATRQDPDADVAFLTVAPQTINGVSTEIERVTGGYALGSTAGRGQPGRHMHDPGVLHRLVSRVRLPRLRRRHERHAVDPPNRAWSGDRRSHRWPAPGRLL